MTQWKYENDTLQLSSKVHHIIQPTGPLVPQFILPVLGVVGPATCFPGYDQFLGSTEVTSDICLDYANYIFGPSVNQTSPVMQTIFLLTETWLAKGQSSQFYLLT